MKVVNLASEAQEVTLQFKGLSRKETLAHKLHTTTIGPRSFAVYSVELAQPSRCMSNS